MQYGRSEIVIVVDCSAIIDLLAGTERAGAVERRLFGSAEPIAAPEVLDLAELLDAPLLTTDARLAKAAVAAGGRVEVVTR